MTCPIDNYDNMTVAEVENAISPYTNGLDGLTDSDLVQRHDLVTEVLRHERENKNRITAIDEISAVQSEIEQELSERGLVDPLHDRPEDNESDEEDEEEAEEEDEEGVEEEVEEEEEDDGTESDNDSVGFTGIDGRERCLVRNPQRRGVNVAGKSFNPGEVKDVVLNDRIRQAIRRNELQTVSNTVR